MNNKKKFFRSIQGYEDKIFAGYKYRITTHSKLLTTIKSALPDSLSSHALHCVSSGRKISLYTDSANWSSQLRFYHQSILRAIQSTNPGKFETLQIKIFPKTYKLDKKIKTTLPSVENIDFILKQAENQEDKKLKCALLKLGNTLKNKTNGSKIE